MNFADPFAVFQYSLHLQKKMTMEFIKPKKIFIVDDDEMMLDALHDHLTRKVNHEVQAFTTGEECLKNMGEKPEVVILDYNLNTVSRNAANGMEILTAIKKNFPGTHIIMLSSQERYGIAMQSLVKGAEEYVVKNKDAFEKVEQIINKI
jgi:two-component system OmpR family response regulator